MSPFSSLLVLALAGRCVGGHSEQVQHRFRKPPRPLPLPITWFHCPKCGTSFFNTVIHAPGVCPQLVHDEPDLWVATETFGGMFMANFTAQYNIPKLCPGLVANPNPGAEVGMEQFWPQQKGRILGFFRQPEQRLISAYYDFKSVSSHSDTPAFNPMRSWAWWYEDFAADIPEYIDVVSGCETRLLVREGMVCGGPTKPTPAEEAIALERLHGFAFIGITEQWDLSICLFHAMFGGDCKHFEFKDTRPGPGPESKTTGLYSTNLTGGAVDRFDRKVFAEAQAIFERNLADYGVSEESCQPCYAQARASFS